MLGIQSGGLVHRRKQHVVPAKIAVPKVRGALGKVLLVVFSAIQPYLRGWMKPCRHFTLGIAVDCESQVLQDFLHPLYCTMKHAWSIVFTLRRYHALFDGHLPRQRNKENGSSKHILTAFEKTSSSMSLSTIISKAL